MSMNLGFYMDCVLFCDSTFYRQDGEFKSFFEMSLFKENLIGEEFFRRNPQNMKIEGRTPVRFKFSKYKNFKIGKVEN